MTARRPKTRRQESFIMLSRSFEEDMQGCTLEEIGLMTLILASRMVTPAGVVYRRHEWSDLPGMDAEKIAELLHSLEERGKIVQARNDILVRSWLKRNAFPTPNVMKSAAYAIDHQVNDALQRTVIGTELLRKDIAGVSLASGPTKSDTNSGGRTYLKGQELHYDALQRVWDALYGQDLPSPDSIHGNAAEPNPIMLSQIVESPEYREALPQIKERNWACIHPDIAAALQAHEGVADVAEIRARRRNSG